MNAQQIAMSVTAVSAAALLVLAGLFLLLSLAGRVLTNNEDRSPLGRALGHVYVSAGLFLLAFSGFLVLRLQVGPPPVLLDPYLLNLIVRMVLMVASIWCMIAALIAFPRLVSRFRRRVADSYEVNQAAVFGVLGQALPIIVSDHKGIIQDTTAEFDTLVGALPGQLIGQSLNVIMPERYIAGHDHGMQRYVQTREPHIMGTVVAIDMLRQDGKEIPVYLALNTADVEGNPWFVASIWPKPKVDPDTLPPILPYQEGINIRQDVRETEQNVREVFQDDRAIVQDQRSVVQDQRQVTADDRQATADDRDTTADARDVTAHDRDVTADDRDVTACDRDTIADARDVTADAREAKE